jgi:hypothetical protein
MKERMTAPVPCLLTSCSDMPPIRFTARRRLGG